MKKYLEQIIKYSGIEFVYRKFIPKDKSVLPSGFIWLVGIYVAFFGLASNRYESRVDAIENRFGSIITLIGTDSKELAIEQLVSLHQVNIPVPPNFICPLSSFKAMFGEGEPHIETINNTKGIISALKNDLDSINLANGNFTELDFSDVSFYKTDFSGACLKGTDFSGADLSQTIGLTQELLENSITSTETTFPYYLAFPNNVRPKGNFERIKISPDAEIKSFSYKALRNFYFYIKLTAPDYDTDDIILTLDGDTLNNLYFDEDIYGPFGYLQYSKPGILKMTGKGLEASFSDPYFDWRLESLDGNDLIEWNYMDVYENDTFKIVGWTDGHYEPNDTVNAIGLADGYLLVEPVIETESRFLIQAVIPRGRGETIGFLFTNEYEDSTDYQYRYEYFRKYIDTDSISLYKACSDGAFLLLNVPEFRIETIINDLEENGEDVLIVLSDTVKEIN